MLGLLVCVGRHANEDPVRRRILAQHSVVSMSNTISSTRLTSICQNGRYLLTRFSMTV